MRDPKEGFGIDRSPVCWPGVPLQGPTPTGTLALLPKGARWARLQINFELSVWTPAPNSANGRISLSTTQREGRLSAGVAHRKVLIVEDQPSVRNVLYVLLAGLNCEGDIAHTSRQALASICQESFDAVLLDLRCCELPPEEVVSQIKELRPNLVGRVLVITGEVTNTETMQMIERHCLPYISRNRLPEELRGRLRTLLGLTYPPADPIN